VNLRYICADLRTGVTLVELPFQAVTFGLKLNDAGSFAGTLNLADAKIRAADPIDNTQTQRTALYVVADSDDFGVILWGGIIWTRRYDSTTRQLQIGASDFWSYFARRRVTIDYKPFFVDQLTIAAHLINAAQSAPGGDIGVVPTYTASGVHVTEVYNGYEYKQVDQAITDLAGADNGFDFAPIYVAYADDGSITKTMQLDWPRRGRVAGSTGLVFDLSSADCLSYVWPEDGSQSANTIYALGTGSGTSQLEATASDTTQIDGGYPLLEDTYSAKSELSQFQLGLRGLAYLAAVEAPITQPEITFRADGTVPLGSFLVGDDARIRCDADPFFPFGLDAYWRINQLDVTPGDEGVPTMKLTLAVPPDLSSADPTGGAH
jgi:hypothetical protein